MVTKEQIPFVRILVFFIIGIIIADCFKNLKLNPYYYGILSVLLFLTVLLKSKIYTYLNLSSIILSALIMLTGFSVYKLNDTSLSPYYLGQQKEKIVIKIEITSAPKKAKRWRYEGEILAQLNHTEWKRKSGNMILYLDTTHYTTEIDIGDILDIQSKVYLIKQNTNPNTFDFKSYLYYQGIQLQSYISAANIIDHTNPEKTTLYITTQKWRKKAYEVLCHYIKDKDQLAIAAAMSLGIKNNLSVELYQSFSNSGAVHVLAVSGLHVGFIAMIVFFLLNLIPFQSKYFKLLKTLILLTTIFLYGLLTGMAPAIMRATIMYSLLIIAKSWRPSTSNYNVLAFSAFIMLIYDPYMLFQAGFQFSYLAILGIMIFYTPIRTLFYTNKPILTKIVDMIAISFAAQLTVFPITIYYFHKFPTYFFISGLIAIPAAMFIIILIVTLFLLHGIFPWLNVYIIAPILKTILYIMIQGIDWINSWPMANIEPIHISQTMLITIYILLASMTTFFLLQKKQFLIWTLCCIITTLGLNLNHEYNASKNSNIIIYDSPKGFCMDIINGINVYCIKSDRLTEKDEAFINKNHRLSIGTVETSLIFLRDSIKTQDLYYNNNILIYNGIRFYIASGEKFQKLDDTLNVDYLILCENNKNTIHDYLSFINPKNIIVDQSIQKKTYWNIKRESKSVQKEIIYIKERGAYFIPNK